MSGVVGSPFRKFVRPSWRSVNGQDTLPDVSEGWEALLDVRQLSGGPPGCAEGPPSCPGVVGWPFRMSVSGRETLLNVWEASRMSGSGREALPDVQEALSNVRECSKGPLGCPRVVGRLSRKFGRGWEAHTDVREWMGDPGNVREWWEALPNVREWSVVPPKCLAVVRRPSRMSSSGREAHPDVQKWWRDPPECPPVVGRPFRMSGSGR